MITTTDINSRFYHYLLLNGSFMDNVGLSRGKSALPLYLYYTMGNTIESFSFLEEIISQINAGTSSSFANGVSGFGIVLEHLIQSGLLEEDANEILEECDKTVTQIAQSSLVNDISIANGVSGIGLYLLHRLTTNQPHRNMLFFNHRLIDSVMKCIFKIEKMFVSYRLGNAVFPQGTSCWEHPASSLLLLSAARSAAIPEPRLELITQDIISFLHTRLAGQKFSWDTVDIWYLLLYAGNRLENKTICPALLSSFQKKLHTEPLSIERMDLLKAPFTALLLHLIHKEHSLPSARHLSENMVKSIRSYLQKNSLATIVPYDDELQGVPLGLDGGASGMALSLWSLQHQNYQWLSTLGISI